MLRKYLRIKYIAIVGGIVVFVIVTQIFWNHSHPQVKLVSATFSYNCQGDPESLLCLEKSYQSLTEQKGVTTAFATLKAQYNTYPAVHDN